MSPEEKTVIAGIFDRVKQVENEPRDPEAERLIDDLVRRQPYAPYVMSQAIHVQEQALMALNAQVEDLKAQVAELSRRPQSSGGFLSGLFGGGRQVEPAPPARPMGVPAGLGAGSPGLGGLGGATAMVPGAAQAAGPWGAQRPSFLGGAMTTALGVAGGLVLGNILMSAFAGDSANAAAATPASEDSAAAEPAEAPAGDVAADDGGLDMGSFDEF